MIPPPPFKPTKVSTTHIVIAAVTVAILSALFVAVLAKALREAQEQKPPTQAEVEAFWDHLATGPDAQN